MKIKPPPDYSVLDSPDVSTILFHPRSADADQAGDGQYLTLRIPVDDDVHLGARFHMGHADAPTILFFHGNGEIVSDYDEIGPLYLRLGINFMAIDYRGYGWSDGIPTVSAMMTDCHRALDFAENWKGENGYSGKTIIMGRSLGSAPALELAATHKDRIDGLVIESGFARAMPLLRLLGLDPDGIGFDESNGFSNLAKIKTVAMPTVIIHAEFDHIIPFGEGQALFDACGATDKSLIEIPGANHNDIFLRGLDHYLQAIGRLSKKISLG